MPLYEAPQFSVDLVSTAIFVDTNVWVSAFDQTDKHHDDAQFFLEATSGLMLVPVSVVVETWGLLLSNRGKPGMDKEICWERCFAFLAWLADPGHNVRMIPEINDSSTYILNLTQNYRIDCVDAMLSHLANHVNNQCGFRPSLSVASMDERDFPRVREKQKLNFQIYNVVSRSPY